MCCIKAGGGVTIKNDCDPQQLHEHSVVVAVVVAVVAVVGTNQK